MGFDVLSIVQMIGGLALFIYGMTTMGKGLERAAGSKLEKTLEKMTGNVVTALLMGMVVTMVIQSSSATTVMVVGFVNAGIMTLKQSVGVILGANIGTTITAQILRLSGGEGSGNLFMDLLKPKNLAYIIVLVGVIIMMIAKKRRTRDIADIFTGFGILFIGMSVMEGAVAPLADLPQFADLFAAISNPVLGVLVGAGVTAIIQSSSASVGILQAVYHGCDHLFGCYPDHPRSEHRYLYHRIPVLGGRLQECPPYRDGTLLLQPDRLHPVPGRHLCDSVHGWFLFLG